MDKTEIRKVAKSIVRDLNNLDLRSKAVQKIAFSYTDKQVEIVFNHLRHLTTKSSGGNDAEGYPLCPCCGVEFPSSRKEPE